MMNSGEEGSPNEESGVSSFGGHHQIAGPQGPSMMGWVRPQTQDSLRGERGSEASAFARPSNAPMSILGPLAQHHAPGGILYQSSQQLAANAQNQLKEAKLTKEDEKDEDMPDFLNDLYHLSYIVTADRFLFTWQRIEYSGELPRVAYPIGVSFEHDFLIFFGGEGYYLHKKYSQDALAESLNTISAVRLENKRAIRLHATGISVEGIHCAACFTQKSSLMQPARIFLYGGQVPSNNMNQRLLVLDLEQRVQRDFFGEFRSLKPMCPCCKLEYETCVNNYEAQLKGNKRLQNRKLDGDRWDPMITEETPRFVIPPEIQEDMLSALELQEEYLDAMSIVTDESAILSQITLIIYTLKKSLYLTSMNFDIANKNAVAIELEGNFNIFEQLDKLEISIMDSIFYYLMNSACLLKIQASLFVKLKTKTLEFTYSHHNRGEIVTREHSETPDLIKDVKYQSNLVVFSKCPVTFTRDEDLKEKDIRLSIDGQFKKFKVEYSIRAYFTLFFAYKEKDFTIKIFGKEIDHLYLEDIMKIGDPQKPVSVFEKNSSAKGIKFMIKQEFSSRNKFMNELVDRLTAIHYSMDYLTYVNHSEVNKAQHDPDFRGSVTIIMEKINPT